MPTVSDSGRARYLAATAVAAPVRMAVIQVQSITASGNASLVVVEDQQAGDVRQPDLWFSG